MNADRFDVIVAGAGMVGACAAFALARGGLRVALVEAAPPPAPVSEAREYDPRVSAISPRTRDILRDLGVWQRLDQARICRYEKMLVWHQHGEASVGFDAVELARDDLGAIVENRLLQQGLREACEHESRVEWFQPDSVEDLPVNDENGVEVKLASGRRLRAGLLLAADGRNSKTRALAGIDAFFGEYRQRAIVANVDTELDHDFTARQRFLSSGPLAFLPLANGQSSIVWSCDDALADEMERADDARFRRALGEAFEFRLGEVTACGARLGFRLGWHECEHWLRGRVLLIGDAAHSVHPLAGQGVNLGFSDVDLLARLLADAGGLRSARPLRRYERQRKSETWLATRGFSALKWLYGIDRPLFAGARDLGMRFVDASPWLRRELMEKAIHNLC